MSYSLYIVESPLNTTTQLTERAIDETDGREVQFTLRTASQLIDGVQYHHEDLVDPLEHPSVNRNCGISYGETEWAHD
jgi:hypothetical protein